METDKSKGWVFITGAFSGIGRASATRLRKDGYRILAGMLDEQQQADFLEGPDPTDGMVPVIIDISSQESIAAALARVSAELGAEGLAGLVNNAGIALAGPIEFLPVDTLRRQLEVNLIGHFAVTQAFIPLVRKGKGRIVNMGSVSSRVSNLFLSPYAMSKHALKAFNDSLRMELAPWGIKVSLMEPGNVATSIWETAFKEVDRFVAALPPEGERLYGGMIRTMMATMGTKGKPRITAAVVAGKVLHAIGSKNPRAYYPIGMDRWIKVTLNRCLPPFLYDRFIFNFLGLGSFRDRHEA